MPYSGRLPIISAIFIAPSGISSMIVLTKKFIAKLSWRFQTSGAAAEASIIKSTGDKQ
jgi:hypothetical protein